MLVLLIYFLKKPLCFPSGSDNKESACNVGNLVRPLGQEDPLENEMAIPLPYSCLQNSINRGSPVGYNQWSQSRT